MSDKQCQIETVDQLLDKALEFEHKDTTEALKYAEKALCLAKECNYGKQEAHSFLRIGRIHWINARFEQAIEYLNQGLDLSVNVGDSYIRSETLTALGNVYVTMQLSDQAVRYYNDGLRIASEHHYSDIESKIFNNLGALHEELKNYHVALAYYQQSLSKASEIKDGYAEAISHFNIGNMLLNVDKSKSKDHINQALNYAKKHEKTILLAHSLYAMGRLYQLNEQFDESIKYLTRSITNAVASKDRHVQVLIYTELGKTYALVDRFKDAKTSYHKAYDIAKGMGIDELMPMIHENLAELYEKNDEKVLAYKHYKMYQAASANLEDKRRKERIQSIDFQSQLDASLKETETYKTLSDELSRSYNKLHILSEIGQNMTSTLELSDIFDKLYYQVNRLMDASSLGVGLLNKAEGVIKFDLYIENDQRHTPFTISTKSKTSWNVLAIKKADVIVINDIEKEYKDYIEGIVNTRGEMMHSAMFAPLIIENETIGVITIQSKNINAYTERQSDLIQTLASYLAIAIKNAQKSKELAVLNAKLKRLSEQDGLTGIPNRRLFDEMYHGMCEKAMEKQTPLSVMVVDIDNFKIFNDDYGHLVGDEVIKCVANFLNNIDKNEKDFVARFGGDEFVLLFDDCDIDRSKEIAMHINQTFKLKPEFLALYHNVTLSIGGVSMIPSSDTPKNHLLEMADRALYECKANGKNQVLIK